jgi:hypothetical protein
MVPTVIRRKVKAINAVVRGDDDAGAIEDAVFAQILFVDAQHVRRRCSIGFHVLIKRKPVVSAHVARLADAEDHGFLEAVEPTKDLLRGNFAEIPGSYGRLYGLK